MVRFQCLDILFANNQVWPWQARGPMQDLGVGPPWAVVSRNRAQSTVLRPF